MRHYMEDPYMSQRMPPYIIELQRQTQALANILHVPMSNVTTYDGLYVSLRTRRDPINTNRKRRFLTVRLKKDGVEVFRSEEDCKTFPTDHLIARLMLIA